MILLTHLKAGFEKKWSALTVTRYSLICDQWQLGASVAKKDDHEESYDAYPFQGMRNESSLSLLVVRRCFHIR
tara:strand:+ start:291 stop:509 length:219 start_codon:yes stop_codon:yes gene_type:complete